MTKCVEGVPLRMATNMHFWIICALNITRSIARLHCCHWSTSKIIVWRNKLSGSIHPLLLWHSQFSNISWIIKYCQNESVKSLRLFRNCPLKHQSISLCFISALLPHGLMERNSIWTVDICANFMNNSY